MPVADKGFCCDQRVLYVPSHGLWIWILQYIKDDDDNTIRVAIASDPTSLAAFQFDYYDWVPGDVAGLPGETWFDQPKVGVSANYLFLSLNTYTVADDDFVASAVLRIPLDQLAARTTPDATCFVSDAFALMPLRSSGDTMYLATHESVSSLAVWPWPDTAPGPTRTRVSDVDPTGRPVRYVRTDHSCPRTGARPEVGDWCADRETDRLSSGWRGGGRLGFTWNAAQDPAGGVPYPFVWSVIIDEASLQVVDHWLIRSDRFAVQYAALGANARGDAGGVVLIGGGDHYMECVGVVRDAHTPDGWDWFQAAKSTTDPREGHAGDYLGVAPDVRSPNGWSGSCMTNHETGVTVHFVRFGRLADRVG
jgi:hypothetical protein